MVRALGGRNMSKLTPNQIKLGNYLKDKNF